MKEFQKVYPNVKIFSGIEQKGYSQENQDYIVYSNFFKNKNDGVFCDVGGSHPLNLNNTRYFEELGWSGLAFEPLPYMKQLWEKDRTAKLFPFALSDNEGEVIFSIVEDLTGWEDMLSFVKETRGINYDHYGYKTKDVSIQTRVLQNVLNEEKISHIDYMSLDVEGHELNVLKGIDFNKVKIDVLTIESNPPDRMMFGDENIRKLMFKNNYIFWGRIMRLDDIYVHKDFINKNKIKMD